MTETKVDELRQQLDLEKAMDYTLADAIREGASVTRGYAGWVGPNGELCALSAAILALKARRMI